MTAIIQSKSTTPNHTTHGGWGQLAQTEHAVAQSALTADLSCDCVFLSHKFLISGKFLTLCLQHFDFAQIEQFWHWWDSILTRLIYWLQNLSRRELKEKVKKVRCAVNCAADEALWLAAWRATPREAVAAPPFVRRRPALQRRPWPRPLLIRWPRRFVQDQTDPKSAVK